MLQEHDQPRSRARRLNAVIAGVSAVLVVILWIVVVASVGYSRQAALERARSDGANLAAAFTNEVSHTMDGVRAAMDLLAQRIRADASFDLQKWAADVPLMAAATIQGSIIGPDGKLVAMTVDPHPAPIDLSDREYFRVHIERSQPDLFIDRPVTGRISKQVKIHVSKRIEGADGRFLGVLVFSIAPKSLTALHRYVDLGAHGVIALKGLDGVLRARFTARSPDGLAGIGASLSEEPRSETIAPDAHGDYVRASVVDGVRRLFSYRRVPDYPLIVTVGLDLADALALADRQAEVFIPLAIVASLLIIGATGFLMREIRKRADREIEASASAAALAASEARLRKSEEHLSRAQRVAGIGSFERDLRTGRVEWSAETYRIFGRPENLAPPSRGEFLDLIHAEDRAAYKATMRASEEGRPAEAIEFRIPGAGGTQRWIRSDFEVVCDADGTPVRRLGTYQDVTERHEAQDELKRSADRLRRSESQLARAQRIGKMGNDYRDLRTDEGEWSDETYRIFGVTRDAFVPTTEDFLALVHPDDRHVIAETRAQIKTGITPPPFRYRIIRPDGTHRHIHRECEIIRDDAGTPVAIAGTVQDVTDFEIAEERRRELERQLHHSQRLEALGTLASGVAHDLNNTFVPILALSKMAARVAPPDSPLKRQLETMLKAGERGRDLVKQILAFCRKQEGSMTEVDLAQIARDALRMMRASLPATTEIVDAIGAVPPVVGDAGQLHQVIVNLMTNAGQAIGAQTGRITARLSRDGPNEVRLAIADSGVGIDEETVGRIFEPFFTTKPVGVGTGLGLSVVHGIVHAHQGRIEVKSRPGEGSEFIVSLPLASASDTGTIPAESAA